MSAMTMSPTRVSAGGRTRGSFGAAIVTVTLASIESPIGSCESADNPDGTIKLHFAVENPQGLSAKAWAVILDETASGRPLEEVAAIDPHAILDLFGSDLSMGKGLGLTGMLQLVHNEARKRLKARAS